MQKRVLDIGQCSFDHASISRQLQSKLGAVVRRSADLTDALELLRHESFDLILVNRKLDCDGSDGIDVIRALKQQPEYAEIPAMLVSNFPQAQQAAVDAGAVQGFGKAALGSPETFEQLQKWLGDSEDPSTNP